MTKNADDHYGVPPLRQAQFERVLMPGGPMELTLAQLERRCLARVTKLVADTTLWPADGFGSSWPIGDFNILIIETTVAPEAECYVQFWSEPKAPVDWEVSSGHANPRLLKFVTARARTTLGGMGFAIGGQARNFGKSVTVANRGDQASVARDILRIFHGAFGYRGATPLVARAIRSSRCRRAVVHTRFTVHDTITLLQQLGYQTRVRRKGKRPIVGGRCQGFEFGVALDVPATNPGEFQCLDFVTSVGQITDGAHAAWGEALNRLNGISRVARGWIDGAGHICIGASLRLAVGVTEEEIGQTITGWHRAAAGLRGGPPKLKAGKRKTPDGADDDPPLEDEDDARRTRLVVH